jgi:hypothetical protein
LRAVPTGRKGDTVCYERITGRILFYVFLNEGHDGGVKKLVGGFGFEVEAARTAVTNPTGVMYATA